MNKEYITLNGKQVAIDGEPNLLELIRKNNVELPTFCYHSELSVYGACRLCIVEIEGMGVQASCSIKPRANMKVKTHTGQLREMRKIFMELLLANNHDDCTTCAKNTHCRLQELASKLGVDDVRFKRSQTHYPVDNSNPSLVRDPDKCILCGDCVRACNEVQGIGAIDFAFRGAKTIVQPAFGKNLDKVECVYCGLCANVCPTGAITVKSDVNRVWIALNDPKKKVIAQIAPAVRVAIGEMFNIPSGEVTTGKIVAALNMLGFDKVFDTSFAADMTVLEEANEFLERKARGENLPIMTSCCPAWVKYAEQYYPDLLNHLSSCKSPQQMFGAVSREVLPAQLGVDNKDIFTVSIMPCTAKKFEAGRPEFIHDGIADVDAVLTTKELGKMIREAGIDFAAIEPEALDMPLGFKTGAGVIFGVTGGVSEAVLRYAAEKVTGKVLDNCDFHEVRGPEDTKVTEISVDDVKLKLCVVHGLANAKKIAEQIRQGTCDYDIVEVMSCPGGCVSGAGQPEGWTTEVTAKRTAGIYRCDKQLQLHKSQDNPFLAKCYEDIFDGQIGGHKAHHALHTEYSSRKRMSDMDLSVTDSDSNARAKVLVCVGTSCYLKGSQKLMHEILDAIQAQGLTDVEVKGTFCFEKCEDGPNVRVNNTVISGATLDKVMAELKSQLATA
ncbi:MAG: iron hydrogenase small subunit [Sedimentisphaerales bacterium]|nr:iron hydrogenase small subunit [Sedimentisphaerales bacterium]